jgi:hypothetical protein
LDKNIFIDRKMADEQPNLASFFSIQIAVDFRNDDECKIHFKTEEKIYGIKLIS